MLPDRSKRYAGVDGEIERLVLAANWQLALIALLVLTLLVVIFPRKALVEKLYQQETLDELTLSYIENLYRADEKNADVALLLARSQQDKMSTQQLDQILWRFATAGDLRQRTEARTILMNGYDRSLTKPGSAADKARWTTRIIELMQQAKEDELPQAMIQQFATRAFGLGQSSLGLVYFSRLNADNPTVVLEKYGDLALGQGHYTEAADYFLQARNSAPTREEAGRLFQKGINTLMAASLFEPALEAARQYVGDLASDPATLRFLSETALAAGDAEAAAGYVRQLVFH